MSGGKTEPVNSSGNRVVWPPVPSEPEEPYRNVALPAAFAPPSPSPTMQQNPFASPAATGVVDSDGIPFALDGLTPSPFAAAAPAVVNVVEPPTPVAEFPPSCPYTGGRSSRPFAQSDPVNIDGTQGQSH